SLLHIRRAAVVEIVESKGGTPIGFDCKVSASNAEIVSIRRIHINRGGALAKDESRDARAVAERKVVKLNYGIGAEKGHGAVFKFHFRTAAICREDVSL